MFNKENRGTCRFTAKAIERISPWADLEAWGNCSWFTCETKMDDKSKKDAVKQFAGILR